ncbi:hypothetical protein BTO06_07745 [Tenacibaculum sp. SZ-18]|uniref:hypothetical protein n=1 Tax=Tenacibaculum sp. SZ-18 TaxID=754423 RepID=UPI000C2CF99A|nr:hypothetical protein [Tenacibaculum sp. SZ-18]AUC15036.1 hypothetical protein BTO06_07745 [Tenacibaculum sp. SZ-18]
MKITSNIPFLAFLILIILLTSCKKTNWRENFRERSTEPFGTYIVKEEMQQLFPDEEILFLKRHIEDYFIEENYYYDSFLGNYVCIKPFAYRLGNSSIDKLLRFAGAGNDIFLSLNFFNSKLEEELEFETKNLDTDAYTIEELKALKGTINLVNDNFDNTSFTYDRNLRRNYFSSYNESRTTILGTHEINDTIRPNFIKIQYQKGNVFLHTQPIAFTNYFLINGNQEYVENVFSYLPNRMVIWDPLRRQSKIRGSDDKTSALSFFMQHPSLKWSLYIAFIGLFLFMFLNARRKQRAIPEVKQLKNSTQDFTHTIANLYLKEENHKNIVSKKIKYFLEKIRSKYHLDTTNLNSNFIERLAAKTGNTEHTTKYLVNTIIALNKKSVCTQDELVRLNTLIENFLVNK